MDSGHSSRPKKSGLTPTQTMPSLALSYFKGKKWPKAIISDSSIPSSESHVGLSPKIRDGFISSTKKPC
jgi:hypothetical protein